VGSSRAFYRRTSDWLGELMPSACAPVRCYAPSHARWVAAATAHFCVVARKRCACAHRFLSGLLIACVQGEPYGAPVRRLTFEEALFGRGSYTKVCSPGRRRGFFARPQVGRTTDRSRRAEARAGCRGKAGHRLSHRVRGTHGFQVTLRWIPRKEDYRNLTSCSRWYLLAPSTSWRR
jgi:hypothetical protein